LRRIKTIGKKSQKNGLCKKQQLHYADINDPSNHPMPRTSPRQPAPEQESLLIDLYEHPGHLLRRAQQISVSIFLDELGGDVTPVQYAVLRTLSNHPGIDQVTLAGLVGIDTSTGATVCVRLEEKGWLVRKVIPHNRRQRALNITAAGETLLADLIPAVQRLRKRLMAPLAADEQVQFMQLLDKLVRGNNTESRAPLASLDKTTDNGSDSNDEK
jgi:DNA-binding MarR family transcriptional regulator